MRLDEAGTGAGVALPGTTRELLDEWNWREKAELAVSYARETGTGAYDPADLERVAPISNPQKVVAVGLNYGEHAGEGDFDVPDSPVSFSKFPQSLVGPGADVEWDPELTSAVDYEGELVAVVGERPRNVDDPHALDIWTEVNGDRLQDSNTEHLIFGIDEIVAFCSRAFTLEPGDVIYTGTPDGVGFFRDPQVLLSDGDTVTVGVEGVGEALSRATNWT